MRDDVTDGNSRTVINDEHVHELHQIKVETGSVGGVLLKNKRTGAIETRIAPGQSVDNFNPRGDTWLAEADGGTATLYWSRAFHFGDPMEELVR